MAEHGFLDRDLLEDGLDDQIDVGNVRVGRRRTDAPEALFHAGRTQLALLDQLVVDRANSRDGSIQRGPLQVEQRHRQSRIRATDGDGGSHGAATEHRDTADTLRPGIAAHLGRRAFAEESVTQSLRLIGRQQLAKECQFALDPLVEGQFDGRADGADALHLCGSRAAQCGHLRVKVLAGLPTRGQRGRHVAQARQQSAQARVLCERTRLHEEIALVGQAGELEMLSLLRIDRLAGQHHLQGRCDTDRTRQPLCACAGQQTQFDFREAQDRIPGSKPEVTSQRKLEPGAKAGARDGGHVGLRALFDLGKHGAQEGFVKGTSGAQLLDIGPRAERFQAADDDDADRSRVVPSLPDRTQQRPPHLDVERIHGGTIERDDANHSVSAVGNLHHLPLVFCFAQHVKRAGSSRVNRNARG